MSIETAGIAIGVSGLLLTVIFGFGQRFIDKGVRLITARTYRRDDWKFVKFATELDQLRSTNLSRLLRETAFAQAVRRSAIRTLHVSTILPSIFLFITLIYVVAGVFLIFGNPVLGFVWTLYFGAMAVFMWTRISSRLDRNRIATIVVDNAIEGEDVRVISDPLALAREADAQGKRVLTRRRDREKSLRKMRFQQRLDIRSEARRLSQWESDLRKKEIRLEARARVLDEMRDQPDG